MADGDGVGKTETKDNEGAMLQLITKSNTISKKKNPPDSSRHEQCHATREVYHFLACLPIQSSGKHSSDKFSKGRKPTKQQL